MWLSLGNFLPFVFVEDLLALGGLLLWIAGWRGAVVLGAVLLELELLLDVVQILLIHLGEDVLAALLLVADQLRGVGLHLGTRLVTDL